MKTIPMQFMKISDILLDDPSTWNDKCFLTFDIDWACDTILSEVIDMVEAFDVAATWFVTHQTPLLDRLRANPKFELGIHPNFNKLLDGDLGNGSNVIDVVDVLMNLVPEAKSVRSHSMLQSTRILDIFKSYGIVYDCNHFIPYSADIPLKPWKLWNGMIKTPYLWEDDVHAAYNSGNWDCRVVLEGGGLRVFDFHPVHVFLNTADINEFEKAKKYYNDARELMNFINTGMGTKTFLKRLLSA